MTDSVSLVATVRNESASIEPFMCALLAQSRAPDEIVIVDGGSTDGTPGRIRALAAGSAVPVRVIDAPGTSIAAGRNRAIAVAEGSLIAVTDAGTVADRDWLELLLAPLLADPQVGVVSGFFRAGGETAFERGLTTAITPQIAEVDPATFLPSSRSIAFRKACWERAGGYPEWLLHGEDLVFDLELKHAGIRFAFAPAARVTWTARSSLSAYARQYFNYARAEGNAGLFPLRHAIRYSAYLGGALLLVLGLAVEPLVVVALAAGVILYLSKFIRRLLREPPRGGPLLGCALVPVIAVLGDIAKMAGYPVGRFQRRTRPEIAAGWRRLHHGNA
jgi:glycosyltransferase involved in cell wall biosynthesis